MPLETMISRKEQGNPIHAPYQELRHIQLAAIVNTLKEKWDTILILIVLLGALFGLINPRFDAIIASFDAKFSSFEAKNDNRFSALEAKIDNNYSALEAKIDNNYSALETKIDNKFDNLSSMMIIAHIDGDATEEELLAIWQQVEDKQTLTVGGISRRPQITLGTETLA